MSGDHLQFTWRGRLFNWFAPSNCFVCDPLEANCKAYVKPQGLRWEAHIWIRDGQLSEGGCTPAEALDAAHRAWTLKVECVGEPKL